ncbi:MAG: phospholipid carrier-dependent glycosyltransferase [bacterium]
MSKPSWLSNKFILIVIWIIAIAIRIYGANTPAQYYDMGTFEAWSRSFWVHGPSSFFNSVWSDYLPLPILSFAPISLLSDFLHIPFSLVFKLLHLFVELILIYFVGRSLPRQHKLLISFLLLLSPALIGDTSFWGQVDTIPALLGLLSLTTLVSSGSIWSAIFLGLAVAYKPIMILIAPVLWILVIQKGHKFRLPLISAGVFLASGIPTGGWNFFSHLLSRAVEQSGTYPYLTINAFNLWSLVPNMSWIADSTTVFNLSGRNLGYLLFIATIMIILLRWRKRKFSADQAPRVAASILIMFFVFTTRMHERHLLFGLPFLALATLYESWLIVPLILLTLTFSFNLWGAYFWVSHNQTWPYDSSVISLISWVTFLTSLVLVFIGDFQVFWQKMKNIIRKNIILIGILFLATFLRFTNLAYPPTYIFDEVYHAFTAREYLHNHIEAWEWWTTPPKDVAYEWTHPPVAKYGMVVGMLLFGENSFGWRVGSATFGVISIFGLYLLVISLTKSKTIALLSAFLVSIEGLHLSQSRIAMNDIYMLCFFIWSLYLAVKSRWKYAAILYGLALASKWSALYGIVPLAIIYLQSQQFKFNSLILFRYSLFFVRYSLIALSVYVLTFAPFILAGHTWAQWWELHRQMWYYHTHLVATHGYQSTPLQWLFDVRPVWYFVKYLEGHISNIYVLGNPAILWLGLVALVVQTKKLLNIQYSLFVILFLIFTVPWFFSPRIMFFYHYLPSSVFLSVVLASCLNSISKKSIFFILVLCSLSFIIIAPMLYGLPMSTHYWEVFFKFIPSWK